jgi:hypothetical protein
MGRILAAPLWSVIVVLTMYLSCQVADPQEPPWLELQTTAGTLTTDTSSTSISSTTIPSTTSSTGTLQTYSSTGSTTETTSLTSTLTTSLLPVEDILITADLERGNSLVISWQIPATTAYAGAMIRYSTTAHPATTTDGLILSYIEVDDTPNHYYTHAGIPNGEEFYYSIFAYDYELNYAAPVSVSGMAQDLTPPKPISFLGLDNTTPWKVELDWAIPEDEDYLGVMIRYATTGYPASITDGNALDLTTSGGGRISILDSPNDSYTHFCDTYNDCANIPNISGRGPMPGFTYYYSAFAYDDNENFANPVHASIEVRHKPPIEIHGYPGNGRIHLQYRLSNWVHLNDSNRDEYMAYIHILHKEGTAPTDYTDGDLIETIEVHGETNPMNPWYYFSHHGITNDVAHCYGIYVTSHLGQGASDILTTCVTPDSGITIIWPNGGSAGEVEDFESYDEAGVFPSSVCAPGDWCSYDTDTSYCGEDRWGIVNDPNLCYSGNRCLWCAKMDDVSPDEMNETPEYDASHRTKTYFEQEFDFSSYDHVSLAFRMIHYFSSYYYFNLRVNDQKVETAIADTNNDHRYSCNNGNNGCDSRDDHYAGFPASWLWRDYHVDLSLWAGQSNVTIQFYFEHLYSSQTSCTYSIDSDNPDGTFIDDLVLEAWND